MASIPVEIIYCADGSRWSVEIAIEAGWTYGARLPNTVYVTPSFVDQDWENPNLDRYLAALIENKPRIATVLDWERMDQFQTVLNWAEAVAAIVDTVVIIPKVIGGIAWLGEKLGRERKIGGKTVRLGYSVQTSFSGTPVSPIEFLGWPVHLLGGCPIKQMRMAGIVDGQPRLLDTDRLNVVSVDCNYHLKMATKYNQFCVPDGSAWYAQNRYWPTLKELNGGKKYGDGSAKANAPHEAFRRSCENIMAAWDGR